VLDADKKKFFRVTIPYNTEIPFKGHKYKIHIDQFNVSKCQNCSHVVFDFEADDQIYRAIQEAIGEDLFS
tara:strand:+ start:1893 stop:2102 length:210 start_codon:yes stop_codon:yes gene_type:complete